MKTEKEKLFHKAMLGIYVVAKEECNYVATRFLKMLTNHGGIETAKILLHSSHVSEGYTALWERKRLDLTVEALVVKDAWSDLFSEEEINIAKNRLYEYGYKF